MNKTPCILIISSLFLPSVLSFARSLGKKGIPIYVINLSKKTTHIKLSRYVTDVLSIEDNNYHIISQKIVQWWSNKGHQKGILIPLSDIGSDLMTSEKDTLETTFILSNPSCDIVHTFHDKNNAEAFMRTIGVNTPTTHGITSPEDINNAMEAIKFPAIIKPNSACRDTSKSFKTTIVHDKTMFNDSCLAHLANYTSLIAQHYIPGDDTHIHWYMFVRDKNGNIRAECSGIKLLQFPNNAGIMAAGMSAKDDDIINLSREIINKINYVGTGGIEYKKHNEHIYFIELNTRSEGFVQLSVSSGVDIPYATHANHTNTTNSAYAQKDNILYLDELTLFSLTLSNPKSLLKLIRLISKYRIRSTTTGIACLADPLPIIITAFALLTKAVAKFLNKTTELSKRALRRTRHRQIDS